MVLVRASIFALLLLSAAILSACANATEPKQESESDDKPVEIRAVPVGPVIPEMPERPETVAPEVPVITPKEITPTPKSPAVEQCEGQPEKKGCNGRSDPPEDTPRKPEDTGPPSKTNTPEVPQTKKVDLTVKFDPPVTITSPAPILIVSEKEKDGIEEWIQAILIPVILWLMSMLALYNVRRHRLIETLKVDMVNQLRSQFEWLGQIEKWLEEHDTLDRLPIYSNVSDTVFKESLGDIKRYLWDKELGRVHMFYECIGEVQKTLDAGLSFHNKMKNSSEPSAVSLVDFQSDLKLRSSEDLWEKICEAYSASLLILLRLAAPIIGEKKPKLIREISPRPSNSQFNVLIDTFFVKDWIWRLLFLFLPLVVAIIISFAVFWSKSIFLIEFAVSLSVLTALVLYALHWSAKSLSPSYSLSELVDEKKKPSGQEGFRGNAE